MDYGNQILKMTNPEDRLALAKSVGEQDSQRGAKLSTLVNALGAQEVLDARAFSVASKLQDLKTRGDLAATLVIDPSKLQSTLAARDEALTSPLEETEETGGVGVSAIVDNPGGFTDEEVFRLGSPTEKTNRTAYRKDQQEKAIEASNRTEDKAVAKEDRIYNRIDAARKALATSPNTKAYQEAASNQKNLEIFLNGNSAQDDLAAVQVLTRVLNPGNMVTVQETGQVMSAQSYIEMIRGKISKLATGGSQLSASTKAQMRNLGLTAVTSFGDLYSQEARALYKPIAEYGRPIEDILTFPLSPEKKNTARSPKAQAALVYLKQGQK
jgi:hypothetical protein